MKLYLFQKAWDLIDLNPYAMKVETFIRFTKLKHDIAYEPNSHNAPKGQLPYLTDDEKIISDSSDIIQYLKAKYQLTIDNDLTSTQTSITLLIQRLLEEHMYSIILYSRMIDPNGLKVFERDLFSKAEDYNEEKVQMLSANIKKMIDGRGIGMLDKKKIYQLGIANLSSISNLMPDTHYFFGDTPSTVDAIVYSFLANIQGVPIDTPINEFVENDQRLKSYCQFIKKGYYV